MLKGEPSFFSTSRFPAALAATSLSKAAEEVMDTRERKELDEAWWSVAAPADEPWFRSLTFLESAARVELADCGLNGELKASKRTTSSARPAPPRAGTAEELDEEEEVEEEATAFLS